MECALTLGAVELGLAIFRPVPFSIESSMYFEADPYTGYRLKPGGVGHYKMSIPAVANSHGHRDIEVPLKKPPVTDKEAIENQIGLEIPLQSVITLDTVAHAGEENARRIPDYLVKRGFAQT
jgi:hypothetical protein